MNSREAWGRLRMVVVLLLVIQFVSVVLMWTLNPVGQRSQTVFALLLSADLVAFSSVSYVNRKGSRGEGVRVGMLVAGSAIVLLFMFLILLV